MNGRLLSASGDIYVVDGSNAVRRAQTTKERTIGLLLTTLHTFQGECFTNYEAGVPWFDSILGESVLFVDEISEELKEKIRSVEGVKDVLDIDVKLDERTISGTFKVRLDDGSVEVGSF